MGVCGSWAAPGVVCSLLQNRKSLNHGDTDDTEKKLKTAYRLSVRSFVAKGFAFGSKIGPFARTKNPTPYAPNFLTGGRRVYGFKLSPRRSRSSSARHCWKPSLNPFTTLCGLRFGTYTVC